MLGLQGGAITPRSSSCYVGHGRGHCGKREKLSWEPERAHFHNKAIAWIIHLFMINPFRRAEPPMTHLPLQSPLHKCYYLVTLGIVFQHEFCWGTLKPWLTGQRKGVASIVLSITTYCLKLGLGIFLLKHCHVEEPGCLMEVTLEPQFICKTELVIVCPL